MQTEEERDTQSIAIIWERRARAAEAQLEQAEIVSRRLREQYEEAELFRTEGLRRISEHLEKERRLEAEKGELAEQARKLQNALDHRNNQIVAMTELILENNRLRKGAK
jgi:hypothetical protein